MDHDHDHGGMGGGSGSGAMCPMIMTFHGGHCERILWKSWVASTVVEFVFSALALFLLAFLYEGLKFVREHFLRQTVRKEAERVAAELQAKQAGHSQGPAGMSCHATVPACTMAEIREKSYIQRICNTPHLIQTSLNLVQIIISYLLMLVFMNFNYWLCLAVILGLGIGYFFFGWIKQDVYESECCQ